MSKVCFANIYCNTLHYPVVDYLMQLITKLKENDEVILCFWDKTIYQFQEKSIHLLKSNEKREKNLELVDALRSILAYHKIKSKVIFLSDAFNRLAKDEKLFSLLNKTLGKLTLGYIEDMYNLNKYLTHRPLTISKVMYMVSDYIVALGFSSLHRELNVKKIDYYYTGERFKVVYEKINESILEYNSIYKKPAIWYVSTIPIISYESGRWISLGMEKEEIKNMIQNADFRKGIDVSDFKEMFEIIGRLLGREKIKLIKYNNNETENLNYNPQTLAEMDKKELVDSLSLGFYDYMQHLENDVMVVDPNQGMKKVNYIKTPEQLKNIMCMLNPSKMEILRLCDGNNTIKEIVKKSSIKASSVQSYISQLRANDIITKDSKPKKRVDEILISL